MATKKTPARKGKATSTPEEVTLVRIQSRRVRLAVLGESPLCFNRLAEKARQQLLLPQPRKKAAERLEDKHAPYLEYNSSIYRCADGPTLIGLPATAFKSAMATVTADLPGLARAQVNRLVTVPIGNVAIYGTPQIYSTIVRSADMNRTPDVRTRAILPHWCCYIDVEYAHPLMTEATILGLLSNAGITVGVGDFRQEKGRGSMGKFMLATGNEPEFRHLVTQGRKVQEEAMTSPEFYDGETEELLSWYGRQRTKLREAEDVERHVTIVDGNGADPEAELTE